MFDYLKTYAAYWIAALLAVVVIAWLTIGGAFAGDLGGSCCADLEDRVAELEATTARKGNRKVSLTVSGWVAEQIVYWDDGLEQNTYIGGLGSTLATHVKFSGQATITPGWIAGYVLQIESNSNDALEWNQEGHGPSSIGVFQSFWFLKAENVGKISVGLQSTASDNAALLADGSGSAVAANWVLFDGDGFFLRVKGEPGYSDLTWDDLASCRNGGAAGDCNGVPRNAVRFDSPTVSGFSASAAWGEDDYWDGAIRYAGELAGFKVALTAAYAEATDPLLITGFNEANQTQYWQGGAYVQHVASGVFLYGAHGRLQTDGTSNWDNGGPALSIPDGTTWYGKAGLRQKPFAIGHTVVYGEYLRSEDQLSDAGLDAGPPGWDGTGSELTMWGLGVVQEIDNAGMSIWLKYRHMEGDLDMTCNGQGRRNPCEEGETSKYDFEPIQFFGLGGLVNF